MPVFAVIATVNPAALKTAVVTQYGANHYEFSPTVWFVPDVGTTEQVSNKLGLAGGKIGAQGVVLRFTGFSGYAGANAWTWLQSNSDAVTNG
jgi:hypothetical protein